MRGAGWSGPVWCEVVYGLAGGLVVPALAVMIARWEPQSERGRLATVIYSGSQASGVLSSLLTGYLCHHSPHHWRSGCSLEVRGPSLSMPELHLGPVVDQRAGG